MGSVSRIFIVRFLDAKERKKAQHGIFFLFSLGNVVLPVSKTDAFLELAHAQWSYLEQT